MPKMSEKARQNKMAYDIRYMKENVTRKYVSFNRTDPEDAKLLEWIDQKQNVNQYIKDLVNDDMKKAGK